jgi:uncharacterized cupin superfamily protein
MGSTLVQKNLDPKKRKRARKHEVFQISDVPRVAWRAGKRFGGVYRSLGAFGRSEHVGVNLEDVPPGKSSTVFHWHTAEEEHVWILAGRGIMRIGRREIPVRAGSYVVFPPSSGVPHSTRNTGKTALRILVIGTREKADVCVYPDSGKVAIGALRRIGRLHAADYWDGEV